jgi:hypothetical protein
MFLLLDRRRGPKKFSSGREPLEARAVVSYDHGGVFETESNGDGGGAGGSGGGGGGDKNDHKNASSAGKFD